MWENFENNNWFESVDMPKEQKIPSIDELEQQNIKQQEYKKLIKLNEITSNFKENYWENWLYITQLTNNPYMAFDNIFLDYMNQEWGSYTSDVLKNLWFKNLIKQLWKNNISILKKITKGYLNGNLNIEEGIHNEYLNFHSFLEEIDKIDLNKFSFNEEIPKEQKIDLFVESWGTDVLLENLWEDPTKNLNDAINNINSILPKWYHIDYENSWIQAKSLDKPKVTNIEYQNIILTTPNWKIEEPIWSIKMWKQNISIDGVPVKILTVEEAENKIKEMLFKFSKTENIDPNSTEIEQKVDKVWDIAFKRILSIKNEFLKNLDSLTWNDLFEWDKEVYDKLLEIYDYLESSEKLEIDTKIKEYLKWEKIELTSNYKIKKESWFLTIEPQYIKTEGFTAWIELYYWKTNTSDQIGSIEKDPIKEHWETNNWIIDNAEIKKSVFQNVEEIKKMMKNNSEPFDLLSSNALQNLLEQTYSSFSSDIQKITRKIEKFILKNLNEKALPNWWEIFQNISFHKWWSFSIHWIEKWTGILKLNSFNDKEKFNDIIIKKFWDSIKNLVSQEEINNDLKYYRKY